MSTTLFLHEIPKQRVKRRVFRKVAAASLWTIGIAATGFIVWHMGQPPKFAKWTSVTVQPGDTMWNLALKADPSADTRLVIEAIKQKNNLGTSRIWAGESIQVPVGVGK